MASTIFVIGLVLGGLNSFNTILINGFFVVVIANIPQGLPVTLSAQVFDSLYVPFKGHLQLIITARKLSKMGIFIKRSDVADTLGLTSVLVIDKSMLLAPDKMELTKMWLNRQILSVEEASVITSNASNTTLHQIMDIISVCNPNASIDSTSPFDEVAIEGCKHGV